MEDPSWYLQHYLHHPMRNVPSRKSESMTGVGNGAKPKVYCRACFAAHRAEIFRQDEVDHQMGKILSRRTPEEIASYLWGLHVIETKHSVTQKLGWRRGVKDTGIHHLSQCDHVDAAVRATARDVKDAVRARKSPRKESSTYFAEAGEGSSPLSFAQPSPLPYALRTLGTSSSSLSLSTTPAGPSPTAGSFSESPLIFHQSQSLPPTIPPSPLLAHDAMGPMLLGRSSRTLSRSVSQSRVHSRSGSVVSLSGMGTVHGFAPHGNLPSSARFSIEWSEQDQQDFRECLARVTAACNLPSTWLDNPTTIQLFSHFLPGLRRVTRSTMTRTIIPNLVQKIKQDLKITLNQKQATLQGDGWTGINQRHVVAFMVTVEGKVYTVETVDATAVTRNAEHFLGLLEHAKAKAEADLGVKVICVVTDASGESAKARRLFEEKNPDIIVLDCYAHQANLVTGDYFRAADDPLVKIAVLACELITWLRSKTKLLELIRLCYALYHNGASIAVIRAALTRWTSHYLALHRLLVLKPTLQSVIADDELRVESGKESLIIPSDSSGAVKARSMIAVVRNASFWHDLARVVRHLRPLAIATNVLQSVSCRLDMVLVTFGFLAMQFANLKDPNRNPEAERDAAGCDRILNSLEKRWMKLKAKQDIFIAAVILNPMLHQNLFKSTDETELLFTRSGLVNLLKTIYRRFFGTLHPDLDSEIRDYLSRSGRYRRLNEEVEAEIRAAGIPGNPESREFNPLRVFESFKTLNRPNTPLVDLATRIFSAKTNSASCERLFSAFGNLLTKLRNRLTMQNMQNITDLAMHIKDENRNDEQVHQRLRRHFEPDNVPGSSSAPETTRVARDQMRTPDITPLDLDQPPFSAGQSITPTADTNSFLAFIESQTRILEAEEDDDILDDLTPRSEDVEGCFPIRLQDLFDFNNQAWQTRYKVAGIKTLDDELDLYGLLDDDAAGESDELLDASTESAVLAMMSQTG